MDYEAMLKQLQDKPRVHGYISDMTEARMSPIQGIGLFAKTQIPEGEVVVVWGGKVTTKAEVESLPSEIAYNYALQLYPGFYLAERTMDELDSADFINHSCDPNSTIVNKFVLITAKDIQQGEEITADFSNDRNEGDTFVCNCGSKNCKGTIYTG